MDTHYVDQKTPIFNRGIAKADALLIAGGYKPIAVSGKAPVGNAWQSRPNTIEAIATERAAHPRAVSTGLRTGELVGVDIDIVDPAHAQLMKELASAPLGFTLMERVGSKGAMLCYRNETPIRKITIGGSHPTALDTKGRPRREKVEILGAGQQFVGYGVHPDTGRPYNWPNAIIGAEPLLTPLAELEAVTPTSLREFAGQAAALFAELGYSDVVVSGIADPAALAEREEQRRASKVPVGAVELVEVLRCIDPGCDRTAWIGFLGGILATPLRDVPAGDMDDRLTKIAQAWSRGDYWRGGAPANWGCDAAGNTFDGDDDVAHAVDTLTPDKAGGTSFGTLYRAARENGYDKPPPQPTDDEVFRGVEPPPQATQVEGDAFIGKRVVRLTTGAGVRPRPIDWLWPGYLARGKYHAFGGGKGAGKSTIVYDLAARMTAGGQWPDGQPAPLGDVLVWSGEDDFVDTILPRFLVAGGEPGRLYHVEDVTTNGDPRPFDPAIDVPGLIQAVRQLAHVGMIVIDPVVSAVAGDSHKNAETRRGLQPLVDLAEDRHAALVGITHFSKNTQGRDPIERLTGSLAFGALARVALGAVKGSEENDPRRFVRIASNIGKSGGGFEYLLRQDMIPGETFAAQRVIWGKQLSGSAGALLEACEAQSAGLKAIAFLENTLRANGGSMMARELREAADANGFSWSTIKRAKEQLGGKIAVKKNEGATHGGWRWDLTEDKVLYPPAANPW